MKKAINKLILTALFCSLVLQNIKAMINVQNLTGKVYGNLTVLSFSHVAPGNFYYWNCLCSKCNQISKKRTGDLNYGHTGCKCNHSNGLTHGMSKSKEYSIWKGMCERCHSETATTYFRYGERGITVCDEWRTSFKKFYEDMGPVPTPNHSIDRIENDKGYYKENCRWSTTKEQANNKTNNYRVEYLGETKTLTEWCDLRGMNWNTVKSRIKSGWSVYDSFNRPIDVTKRRKI